MNNGWVVRVGEGDCLFENRDSDKRDSDKKALMPLAKLYWPLD